MLIFFSSNVMGEIFSPLCRYHLLIVNGKVLQNSPLPPSLGSMPQFPMMGTPPRPLHLNGGVRPMHPGRRAGRYSGVNWKGEGEVNTAEKYAF